MAISQPHNLRHNPDARTQHPYGVRVSLRSGDPFRKLLGDEWSRTHWYASAAERDAALVEMSRRHEYSRASDAPALRYEKVEKLGESRGF